MARIGLGVFEPEGLARHLSVPPQLRGIEIDRTHV